MAKCAPKDAQIFNDALFFVAFAAVQPATPHEVLLFLRATFDEIQAWPEPEYLERLVMHWVELERITEARKGYYSLTKRGNDALTGSEHRVRDKLRLSLLRQCRNASLSRSEAGDKELGGVAPSSDTSTDIKEAPWPEPAGPVPSRQEATRHRAGRFWPRVVEQLSQVGLVSPASDIARLGPLRYCSFRTLADIQRATGVVGPEHDMTLTQLALAIGVSPRLISLLALKASSHYRLFQLPKKGGGVRTIHAPRFFLKTVQYWILDYILQGLRIHQCCHAYIRGRSIATNARQHVGMAYVSNLDISQFFDSISENDVICTLRNNGVGAHLAAAIAGLVTLDSSLPQGAPTSPVISNAFLFDADEIISAACGPLAVRYTRYADDITLSSNSSSAVKQAMQVVSDAVNRKGLELNRAKTRIASARSSQRVTGLVVNEGVRPPRGYRRSVRSEFHHAMTDRGQPVTREKFDRLRGHLSYLSSFPELEGGQELRKFAQQLKTLADQIERQ